MSQVNPLTLLAAAASDVEEAVRRYDDLSPGLGHAFILDLCELLTHVKHHPEMFQTVKGRVRRAVFQGFPSSLLYRIHVGRTEVIGVLPSRGDPERIAARLLHPRQ
jgi:hypothetical protein